MARVSSQRDVDDLQRRVAEVNWFHTIDLGDGIVTPGWDDSPSRLPRMDIPDDLTGMSVLDVGAWDGFFSFEAERRGAARVLATDSFSWEGDGWGSQAGFELAHEALGSRVESRTIDVRDLSPETVGVFDLVLFLGVLYHMRDPLLALERVASVTGKQLILDTHVDLIHTPRPAAAFYPGDEMNGDASNWWGPNPASRRCSGRSGSSALSSSRARVAFPIRSCAGYGESGRGSVRSVVRSATDG